MNEVLIAVILGIIEGLTEFVPVSSTGHLIIAGHLLGFHGEEASSFEIFIQLGAILAVVALYYDRFLGLVRVGEHRGENAFSGFQGIVRISLACLPALIVGAVAHSYIKTYLFNPLVVSVSLIVGGVVLLVVKETETARVDTLDRISKRQCLLIGLFQLLSLCPGVSRSGATIVGGMLLGCSKRVAAEFSFLVAVPVMCAAVAYDLYKSADSIPAEAYGTFAVGFVVSFLVAILAIRVFLSFLNRYSLGLFGIYRILVGLLFLWIFSG